MKIANLIHSRSSSIAIQFSCLCVLGSISKLLDRSRRNTILASMASRIKFTGFFIWGHLNYLVYTTQQELWKNSYNRVLPNNQGQTRNFPTRSLINTLKDRCLCYSWGCTFLTTVVISDVPFSIVLLSVKYFSYVGT